MERIVLAREVFSCFGNVIGEEMVEPAFGAFELGLGGWLRFIGHDGVVTGNLVSNCELYIRLVRAYLEMRIVSHYELAVLTMNS